MLPTIAFVYITWSFMWVLTFMFQEGHFIPLDPVIQEYIDMGLSIYHVLTLFLIIYFYFQSYQHRNHLKFDHWEQKFWLFVGIVAALANIGKNISNGSQGLDNPMFFFPATIQNVLVYIASIYCIVLLDGWPMETESGCAKFSVYLLIISQGIINVTLFVEAIDSYLYPPEGSSLQLLYLTLYRSWLIYFGWKKIDFLSRKTQRWNCEIFIHSVCYGKLQEETERRLGESQTLRAVSHRYIQLTNLISPSETEYDDPSAGRMEAGSFYYVRYSGGF